METDQVLEVIPLGGLGEFGMHMMALRSAGSIIVVYAGIMFPDEELHDLVNSYGLSVKDASSLMLLENGGRAQFYYDVVDALGGDCVLAVSAKEDVIPAEHLDGVVIAAG